jgi:enamine deaminase RidA (YjgF/YER057c/UK114 family)
MNSSPLQPKSLIVCPGAVAAQVTVAYDRMVLDCPLSWLAGPESQLLAQGSTLVHNENGALLHGTHLLAGVLLGKGAQSLEEESCELYRRMFAITHGLNRYRLWNYVPRINDRIAGVENYVAFNAGRHRAFIEQFGGIHPRELSAASALGSTGGTVALVFIAGPDPVKHYENPLQIPAAHYPECYGKNAPLFARGSRVHAPDGSTSWYLSGTASIRGCASIGADFSHQLQITLENIQRMLVEMEVPVARHAAWNVFLRDRRDLEICRQRLADTFPDDVHQMTFLEADICRSDLLLEIEASFRTLPHQKAAS